MSHHRWSTIDNRNPDRAIRSEPGCKWYLAPWEDGVPIRQPNLELRCVPGERRAGQLSRVAWSRKGHSFRRSCQAGRPVLSGLRGPLRDRETGPGSRVAPRLAKPLRPGLAPDTISCHQKGFRIRFSEISRILNMGSNSSVGPDTHRGVVRIRSSRIRPFRSGSIRSRESSVDPAVSTGLNELDGSIPRLGLLPKERQSSWAHGGSPSIIVS